MFSSQRLMAVVSSFRLACNGYVYETFGISKHFPVKLQELLIRAETLDNSLTAKCFIYDVMRSAFIFVYNILFRFSLKFPFLSITLPLILSFYYVQYFQVVSLLIQYPSLKKYYLKQAEIRH